MEDELAQHFSGAEGVRHGIAADQVVLDQRIAPVGALTDAWRIPVSMALTDESFIDPREFLAAVVDARLAHLAVCQIDRPAVQRWGPLVGSEMVGVEHLRVP